MKRAPLFASALLAVTAIVAPVAQGMAASLSSPVTPVPVDTGTSLPISSFSDVVTDAAHDHVFISSGSGTTSLLVTSDTGAYITAIPMAGASGMTLQWHFLYVAESNASDIAVVDTWSLKVVGRIPTGAHTCPTDVTVVDSRYVAYADTCDGQWARVGVIDRTAKTATPKVLAIPALYAYDPLVKAIPGTTRVIVADRGLDPSGVAIVDVANTPSVVKSTWMLSNGCENLQDIAVDPTGAKFAAACGWPYEHDVFSTTDLSKVDTYPSTSYPDAASISPSGSFFAAGVASSYDAQLYLYANTKSGHVQGRTTNLGGTNQWKSVAPRGLTFSADSKWLFVVSTDGGMYSLHRFSTDRTHSSIKLTAPHVSPAGSPITVTGSLTLGDALVKDGLVLDVSKRVHGVTVHLATTTTTGGGNYIQFTDTPTNTGWTTYLVTFPGDKFHGKAVGSVTVGVK